MDPARLRHSARRRHRHGCSGAHCLAPAGAWEIDLTGAYERLAERGYGYGPAFRDLRRLWTVGDDLCAEVALGDEQRTEARRFTLHPALLDAALHPLLPGVVGDEGEPLLPFTWAGVSATAAGASVLRVRLAGAAAPETANSGSTTVALTVADGTGAPVATVAELTLRPLTAESLRAADAGSADGLLRVEWSRPATADVTADLSAWAVVGPASDLGLPAWHGPLLRRPRRAGTRRRRRRTPACPRPRSPHPRAGR
ncbi:polyketide synthase dehydratase domain-containing protein [Streptomyces sp. MS1.AVA.1]|uniref:Polyketide synthase dehydratase domain-containing protein n=1 Tax=Streptomyces machairae TaxID=3134109 RepID=A0ABU8UHC6_9ACTN